MDSRWNIEVGIYRAELKSGAKIDIYPFFSQGIQLRDRPTLNDKSVSLEACLSQTGRWPSDLEMERVPGDKTRRKIDFLPLQTTVFASLQDALTNQSEISTCRLQPQQIDHFRMLTRHQKMETLINTSAGSTKLWPQKKCDPKWHQKLAKQT